jgi:threonylcarbamoyladenosine tRNA methylthiotransferase MtaB
MTAPRPHTIALTTLGCKVNQAETEALSRRFAEAGFTLTGFDETADVYVLNTCTVTHIADRKARQLLRQARRRNPHALVVATGCPAWTWWCPIAGSPNW